MIDIYPKLQDPDIIELIIKNINGLMIEDFSQSMYNQSSLTPLILFPLLSPVKEIL